MKVKKYSNNDVMTTMIFKDMLHVMPVRPVRYRVKDYREKIPVNWGNITAVEIIARETLNVFDLVTLLAVTRLFLIKKYQDGGDWKDEKGNPVRKMYVVSAGIREFVEEIRGLKWGTRSRQWVYDSLDRLKDCTWRYFYQENDLMTVKVLFDWQIIDSRMHFWVNAKYIDNMLQKKGFLTVILNYVFKCSTDIGKLLVMWLQGQKGSTFSEDTFITVLHLGYTQKTDARKALIRALKDIQQTGYISSFKYSKQNNQVYFTVIR